MDCSYSNWRVDFLTRNHFLIEGAGDWYALLYFHSCRYSVLPTCLSLIFFDIRGPRSKQRNKCHRWWMTGILVNSRYNSRYVSKSRYSSSGFLNNVRTVQYKDILHVSTLQIFKQLFLTFWTRNKLGIFSVNVYVCIRVELIVPLFTKKKKKKKARVFCRLRRCDRLVC